MVIFDELISGIKNIMYLPMPEKDEKFSLSAFKFVRVHIILLKVPNGDFYLNILMSATVNG